MESQSMKDLILHTFLKHFIKYQKAKGQNVNYNYV